jgi:hypothetical protein
MAGVSGANEFAEFADDLAEFQESIPDILEQAAGNTAKEVRRRIVRNLQRSSTSKGGEYNSDKSDYEPGGENDSSTDDFHLDNEESWVIFGPNTSRGGTTRVRIQPTSAVEDRAEYIEYGTSSHEPAGDTPYYFKYNGVMIVVSDAPVETDDGDVVPLGERFDAEPQSVEGVEPLNYFGSALLQVKTEGVLQKELNQAFADVVSENDAFDIQGLGIV